MEPNLLNSILCECRKIEGVISAVRSGLGEAEISVKNSATEPVTGRHYIGLITLYLKTKRIEIMKFQMEDNNFITTIEAAKKIAALLNWRIITTKY